MSDQITDLYHAINRVLNEGYSLTLSKKHDGMVEVHVVRVGEVTRETFDIRSVPVKIDEARREWRDTRPRREP
jgi:hypothetical protein